MQTLIYIIKLLILHSNLEKKNRRSEKKCKSGKIQSSEQVVAVDEMRTLFIYLFFVSFLKILAASQSVSYYNFNEILREYCMGQRM